MMALASWLADAGAVLAQDDVVLLSNGGRVRGRVLEHDPASETRVVLDDDTVRVYPAAHVAEVRYGDDVAAEATPSPRASVQVREAPAPIVRFAASIGAGVIAGRFAWQPTVDAAAGVEVLPDAAIPLRLELRGGWEGGASLDPGSLSSEGLPTLGAGRLVLSAGIGVIALHRFVVRVRAGVGAWMSEARDGLALAGLVEIAAQLVARIPPGDHVEVGIELAGRGSWDGATNPFGLLVFVGTVN